MLLHFVGIKACHPFKVYDALIITYPTLIAKRFLLDTNELGD